MINETQLLWKARQLQGQIDPPTHASVAELVAVHGIDLATAALYLCVREHHRSFIDAVDRAPSSPDLLPSIPKALWIAPAAGYRERPEYGGDGAVLKSVGADFGMEAQTLPLDSLGSIESNALSLRAMLAQAEPKSVLLATISKGAAELKVAMREPGRHRDALCGWLNVVGLLEGTPILDWGRRHPRTWLVVRLLMMMRRIDRGFIDGLSHRTPLLRGPVGLPDDVPTVSVVGFPLRCHLDGTIALRHGHIAPLGPNDGYGLILDAMAPGHVYPVWGATHYLRTAGLSRTFYGIFTQLAAVLR